MSLSRYLSDVRQEIERLDDYGFAESIDFHEEIRAGKQALLRIGIVLMDSSILLIKEYIDSKYGIEKVSYAYQYHDGDGKLLFRYDNAVHKPALNFKDHKHKRDGTVLSIKPPEIKELIDEVISYL